VSVLQVPACSHPDSSRSRRHDREYGIYREAVSGTVARVFLSLACNVTRWSLVVDRDEKINALEEAVRRLEEIRADPRLIAELNFEDARVDGYVTMALSAARSALAIATKSDDPEDIR
jgi:hypothetical protein